MPTGIPNRHWRDTSANLHPFDCDGPGECLHCDRSYTALHDPRRCELCDPTYVQGELRILEVPEGDRYVVVEIEGYSDTVRAKAPRVSLSILDSAICYREVYTDYASPNPGGKSVTRRRDRVQRIVAEMNAADRGLEMVAGGD